MLHDLYARATPEQHELGRAWYPTALRVCRRIAERHGVPTRQAVAVLAVTSPDCQLITNVRWLDTALRTRGAVPVGRYPARMTAAVRAVLSGQLAPRLVVTGPKVTAFYRAILGDEDALVLDRWAIRMATGHVGKPTPAAIREADAAYRTFALEVGLPLREAQSITWKVARDDMIRADGVRVNQLDIHDILADLTALIPWAVTPTTEGGTL